MLDAALATTHARPCSLRLTHSHVHSVTRTTALKVKTESYAWLNTAACEVKPGLELVGRMSEKAARPCTGERKWLTGFDLNISPRVRRSIFDKVGADTIQRVNGEYAEKRRIAKRYRTEVAHEPRSSAFLWLGALQSGKLESAKVAPSGSVARPFGLRARAP